jgi:hypothetical protein
MLAGRQQRFSDLAVQVIINHDADGVDIVRVRDREPAALGTLEAVAISRVVGEVGIDIGNRHQTDRWCIGIRRLSAPCGRRVHGRRPAMPAPMTATTMESVMMITLCVVT